MPAESLAILRQKIRQVRDALLAAVRRAGLPDDCLNWLYFADSTTEAFSDGTTITYRDYGPHAPYRYITAERGTIYRDEGAADLHRFLYYPTSPTISPDNTNWTTACPTKTSVASCLPNSSNSWPPPTPITPHGAKRK